MTDTPPAPPTDSKLCETCVNFTACDLDDPNDEVGKCWLDPLDADDYTPWRARDYTCAQWKERTDAAD